MFCRTGVSGSGEASGFWPHVSEPLLAPNLNKGLRGWRPFARAATRLDSCTSLPSKFCRKEPLKLTSVAFAEEETRETAACLAFAAEACGVGQGRLNTFRGLSDSTYCGIFSSLWMPLLAACLDSRFCSLFLIALTQGSAVQHFYQGVPMTMRRCRSHWVTMRGPSAAARFHCTELFRCIHPGR